MSTHTTCRVSAVGRGPISPTVPEPIFEPRRARAQFADLTRDYTRPLARCGQAALVAMSGKTERSALSRRYA